MSLSVYETATPASAFSASGVFTNPLLSTFDGTTGGTIEKKYFVRNSSILHTYAGLTLTPVDSSGLNLVDGTEGFSWKLKAGNDKPLESEWNTISDGNTINLDDINDSNTYLPFWVRIQVPRATSVQSFDQVTLRITATETLIP